MSAMRPFQCHLGRRSVAGRRRLNPKKERSVIAFGFGYLVDVLEAHTWTSIWEMKSRRNHWRRHAMEFRPRKVAVSSALTRGWRYD